MDVDAIDLSKENIQPLRHGRKANMLGLALQAETDSDVHRRLLEQRDQYEMNIRLYEGDDPLQVRYDYVLWLEQSYPKHGRDCNLIPLLEDTITVFKDDKRYSQDIRFVELIIKFIETQVNAVELYQVVYNLGIGTMCSLLYKSWAEELDLSGDVKRADQIYKLGIAVHAQPLESLMQEHKQFQMSVGRRLMCGEELSSKDEPSEKQQPRQVLGKLKSKVRSARPTFGKAGIVPLCLSNNNAPNKSSANAPLLIYRDDVEEDAAVNNLENYQTNCLPKADLAKKENALKPGNWKKAHKPPRAQHHTYTPSTPSFKVHEDNDTATPATPMSVCPSALKTRKKEFHCPVAIFEPPDPSVKPMYCKNKIYVGGREYQFEEIQAALYEKKRLETLSKDEMDKLGIKMNKLSCLTTPQAVRKIPVDEDIEPSTPSCSSLAHELKTPIVYKDCLTEPITPFQSTSDFKFKTPYQESRFQPVTPFDLFSNQFTEVVMEGTETAKKILESRPTTSAQFPVKDNPKPPEASNVKKFLNFAIYTDD